MHVVWLALPHAHGVNFSGRDSVIAFNFLRLSLIVFPLKNDAACSFDVNGTTKIPR